MSNTLDVIPVFMNCTCYTGEPVLMGLSGGSGATFIEQATNQAVVEQAMAVLSTMFGPRIPRPVGVKITRWLADPFTLGSYSHIPVGILPVAYDIMAQPAGDRLYFAGEATNRQYPATVHGAYLSGLREARQILARIY